MHWSITSKRLKYERDAPLVGPWRAQQRHGGDVAHGGAGGGRRPRAAHRALPRARAQEAPVLYHIPAHVAAMLSNLPVRTDASPGTTSQSAAPCCHPWAGPHSTCKKYNSHKLRKVLKNTHTSTLSGSGPYRACKKMAPMCMYLTVPLRPRRRVSSNTTMSPRRHAVVRAVLGHRVAVKQLALDVRQPHRAHVRLLRGALSRP